MEKTNLLTYSVNEEYESTVSRYKILRVITENNNVKDAYLETQNPRSIPLSDQDIYHIVADNEVNRLDLISFNYYGTPHLWWAIALANNFIDPFVLNRDDIIRIPPLTALYNPDLKILNRG